MEGAHQLEHYQDNLAVLTEGFSLVQGEQGLVLVGEQVEQGEVVVQVSHLQLISKFGTDHATSPVRQNQNLITEQ